MAVRPLDTLLAIKVINLMPGLRPSDRRVGAALVEHFNRKTGRCDPSQERMARLLGYCVRTIIRSTQKLERVGLFEKIRHGAYSNRNAYKPNWQRFAALQVEWNKKLHEQSWSRRSEMSLDEGQSIHVSDDKPVTQTSKANLQSQTCSNRKSIEASNTPPEFLNRVRRLSGSKSADAARVEAERRWTSALHRKFASMPVTYGEVIERIDRTLATAATDAELRDRGSGLWHILKALKLSDYQTIDDDSANAPDRQL